MNNDFEIPPELNVPFRGGKGSPLERSYLRTLKEDLRSNPMAARPLVRGVAQRLIPGMRPTIEKLPAESVLIVMPSSTGRNPVPATLAALVEKERPDISVANAKEEIVAAAYINPSKIKNNWEKRLNDPRRFDFNEKALKSLIEQDRPSFIIDDTISTGESAVILQRQLEKRGLAVGGMIAALASEKYHVRSSDLRRLHDKMSQDYPPKYSSNQLKEDIYVAFAGFPRKKIADFERSFAAQLREGTDKEPIHYQYLAKSSQYYRSEQIDPDHVLERYRPPTLTLEEQLQRDYPKLNPQEVSRYAEILRNQERLSPGRSSPDQEYER